MKMSTKKKIATIVITTVALTAGSVGVSTASTKSTRISITNPGASSVKGPRGIDLAATLSALVTKGTITQAQADAITAAADAARAAVQALKPAKLEKPTKAEKDARLALISTTIGVDTATIKSRLAAGETLATIAGAKKDALIAALVAAETSRIDAAVIAGKITAAQATILKGRLLAHITEDVNEVRPAHPKGEREGGKHGRGHGGEDDDERSPRMPAPKATTAAIA
jgi:hypothetical protein